MANSKVVLANGTVLVDLTSDTVDAEHLALGYTATDRRGNKLIGLMVAGDGGGGEYNVESLDNDDGTQTILINTAEGGSTPSAGIDDTITTYDAENPVAKQYMAEARPIYGNDRTTTVVEKYVDTSAHNDRGGSYVLTGLTAGTIYLLDEVTGRGFKDSVTGSSYTVRNLIPGHVYRWINMAASGTKKIGRIKDTGTLRMLNLDKPNNFRDCGGWPCDGGYMEYGWLYRGARLLTSSGSIQVSDYDKRILRIFCDIRHEIDMRTSSEMPAGVTTSLIGADVAYDLIPMDGGYAGSFALTDSEISKAKRIVQLIMQDVVDGIPVYFHCAGGADRTGTVASILEGVCGVSQVDIDVDFELTSLTPWDGHLRPRYGTSSYGKYWHEWIAYINTLDGDNPWITWCVSAGIPLSLVNAFRKAVINGNPANIGSEDIPDLPDLPDVPTGVNLVPTAIDDDGSIFNGTGYIWGYRINSSGSIVTSTNSSMVLTGYIPIVRGQRLIFDHLKPAGNESGSYAENARIALYGESKNLLSHVKTYALADYANNNAIISDGNNIEQITLMDWPEYVDWSAVRYFRICGYCSTSNSPEIYYGSTSEIPDEPDDPPVIEGNVLPTAIDSDGSPYADGAGYKVGYRVNSSGLEQTNSDSKMIATGFIPFRMGQTLRVENLLMAADSSISGASNYRIAVYDSTFTLVYTKTIYDVVGYADNVHDLADGYITTVTINQLSSSVSGNSGVVYLRMSAKLTSSGAIPAVYIE